MKKDIQYSAEMTFRQFSALTNYLKFHDIIQEITTNHYFKKVALANNVNPNDVKKWVFNSWNTERILRANEKYLEIDDNYFALQWSFPQAYYSVFMLTLAYMTLNGQNSKTHSGIINKFSEFVVNGKYPQSISFYCKGTKKNPEFVNIKKNPSSSTIEFYPSIRESCETQICQFLNSTRKILLDEKRNDKNVAAKFKTNIGKRQKQKLKLSEKEWLQIANMINETNILHLLYRKRIKSNYHEIDSFTYEHLKADQIHKSLIELVEYLNLIHETYILKMIGKSKFLEFYKEYKKGQNIDFLDSRFQKIINLF